MRARLLTGWSLRRIFYLVIGLAFVLQAIFMKEWIAVAAGGYFAAMGLFGFGCAGGNCATGLRSRRTERRG